MAVAVGAGVPDVVEAFSAGFSPPPHAAANPKTPTTQRFMRARLEQRSGLGASARLPRSMRHVVAFVSFAACAPHAASAPPVAATYEIHLRRSSHVGDRAAVVVDATIDEANKTYTEQVLLKNDKTHVRFHLDAVGETREVDALGLPVKTDFAIRALTKGSAALVAPGEHVVVVTALDKKDARVEVDGAPASAEVHDAIDDLVGLSRPGDPDALFDVRARRRIGEAWAFDDGAMAHELLRSGVRAEASALAGRVTLASVEPVAGVTCARLRIDLAVSAFEPAKPLPEGSEITRSRLTVRVDELLPLDARSPRRADETTVHAEFEAFVPVKDQAEVAGVTIERTTDRTRRATYTPL